MLSPLIDSTASRIYESRDSTSRTALALALLNSIVKRPSTKTAEVAGYRFTYSNYNDDTVDIRIVDPQEAEVFHADQPVYKKNETTFNLINSAHALTTEGGDVLDAEFFVDTAMIGGATFVCGAGLVGNIIPNPVALWLAKMGCSHLIIGRNTTIPVSIGSCSEGQTPVECGKEVISSVTDFGLSYSYLHGTVAISEAPTQFSNSHFNLTHKSSKPSFSGTLSATGQYGRSAQALPLLKNGSYTLSFAAPDVAVKVFTVVVSDDLIKIKEHGGGIVYEVDRASGFLPPFDLTLAPPKPFEGEWAGTANVVFGTYEDDADCGGGAVSFSIKDGRASGTSKVIWGYSLNVSGTVSESGYIANGVISNDLYDISGSFTLQLDDKTGKGSGTWQVENECGGNVIVEKK